MILTLTLAACSIDADQGSPATSAPAAPTSPSGPTHGPRLDPDAGADAALPLFSAVVADVWASGERVRGQAYVDALTEAGFTRESMQLTADRSTVGNPAESIQFSVAWTDSDCLVGQVGPSTGEPVTAVMSRFADGSCLAGRTVPVGG